MSEKLNILFLSSWYPNKVTPKNGNFIQKHAQAVAAHCNVFALHIIARKQTEDFVIETELHNNVSETIVYYKKITSKIPIYKHITKLLIRRKAHNLGFRKIIETAKKIDIVHLNVCYPAGIFALYLKKKKHIPFVVTEHWTAYLKNDPTNITLIEKHFIKKIVLKAEYICPVSKDLKKALQKIAPNQHYMVIPNVVNTNIFKPRTAINTTTKVNILHLSNLNDGHKNITGILNVIKQLSKKRSDFKLTIAGDGDVEKFKRKAITLKIPEELIEFESEKTTNEVAQLMRNNDCFLLFSNYESFSVVIAEAWAFGIPVITSICGGITNEVTPENGIQVPVKNENILLEKLDHLISNISTYDKMKIAEKAHVMYSYETVSQQFFDIYNKILTV